MLPYAMGTIRWPDRTWQERAINAFSHKLCCHHGILVRIFLKYHPPSHFHARYGEFEATMDLGTLETIEGELPTRAFHLVRE
jgi:hypothetical protein